jgi:hypothetical protein
MGHVGGRQPLGLAESPLKILSKFNKRTVLRRLKCQPQETLGNCPLVVGITTKQTIHSKVAGPRVRCPGSFFMRRDFQLAIILAVAAIPAGTALMAAPEYLHLTGSALAAAFWGGIALTAVLIVLAVAIALRGEAQAPQKGHGQRMIAILGMAFCGTGFMAFAILFFVQRPLPAKTSSSVENRWIWAPLTASESDNLYEKLRGIGQHSFHIACSRSECSDLAISFDRLFKRLGWPSFIGDGGFLATGVTGILINPVDSGAKSLKSAIETTTILRPDLGSLRGKDVTSPIMLVIGTKPEILASAPTTKQKSQRCNKRTKAALSLSLKKPPLLIPSLLDGLTEANLD